MCPLVIACMILNIFRSVVPILHGALCMRSSAVFFHPSKLSYFIVCSRRTFFFIVILVLKLCFILLRIFFNKITFLYSTFTFCMLSSYCFPAIFTQSLHFKELFFVLYYYITHSQPI